MHQYFTLFVLYFTSFFTLINPFGVMPIFMTMTADIDEKARRKTALKASLVAMFTLFGFAFSGQLLFNFFGISVNSFRVAGGIIFFFVGFDMLHARLGKIKLAEGEVKKYVNDISITPLAIPMICGPGAITNSIVLMEDTPDFTAKLILFFTMFLIMLITWIVLVGASKISNFLGETGNKVLMRLMGLIVMVIAVEFFFSGLKPILQDIFKIN